MIRMRPGKKRAYIQAAQAAGGFYVKDCYPWAIKEGCTREDCPMRKLTLPPEPKETDFLINCTPPGELADFLLVMQAMSELPK